jgi:hypothetical protein
VGNIVSIDDDGLIFLNLSALQNGFELINLETKRKYVLAALSTGKNQFLNKGIVAYYYLRRENRMAK